MDNLFERQTAQKFIDRLNRLTPETAAKWGKMNVAQMLRHCQAPLQIASGEIRFKVNPVIRFLFGKRARKQILSEPQFEKNLPTFAKIIDSHIFEEEKNKLIHFIQKYQEGGKDKLIKEPHPFFGDLSVEEWNALMVKHLDHHLRQFGV